MHGTIKPLRSMENIQMLKTFTSFDSRILFTDSGKMNTSEILVICCVFGICSGLFRESYLAIQDQAYMYKYTYKKETARSFHDCAGRCQESAVCLSFSYSKEGHVCHLNNNNTDIDSIKHRTNFIYANILHKLSICSSDKSCEGEYAGCGEPPELTGADKEYDRQFLHAVTNYTCKTDYVNCCLSKNTSVCQPPGNWENVTGMCGRYMWTNPETDTRLNLPCGPKDSFKVHIAGWPTKYVRMTFNLLTSLGNLVLHFDVRFSLIGYIKQIVITKRINGIWDVQTVLSTFPFTYGRPFAVTITGRNGTFTIEVDNMVLTTYPMVETPDYLIVKRDVSLTSVKFDV